MCILYSSSASIPLQPIPYIKTGRHFFTTNSHLITSDKSLEFNNTL